LLSIVLFANWVCHPDYDKVALSSTIQVSSQAIGVASSSTGFAGVDGVLGLGPKRLSRGTTSQGATVEYPTFTDNLWQKGVTTSNVLSLSLAPTNAVGTINGQVFRSHSYRIRLCLANPLSPSFDHSRGC